MELFKEIHESIDKYAESIASDLSQRRFFNVSEARVMVRANIYSALSEIVSRQVSFLKNKRTDVAESYAKSVGKDRTNLAAKLIRINKDLKEMNILCAKIKDESEYTLLKDFVCNKFGEQVLNEFYQSL